MGLVGIFGVLMPFTFGFEFSDAGVWIFPPLVPLVSLACLEIDLRVFVFLLAGLLYLGLLAVSLWGVRKARGKTARVVGHVVILLAFGTAYAVGWYIVGTEIAAAMFAAALSSL